MLKRLSRRVLASATSLLMLAGFWGSGSIAHAADYIRFRYGVVGGSIAVDDLEQFARTGAVQGNLKLMANRLTPDQRTQLQAALLAPYEVDAALIGQFAYTASGEQLLQEAGELMQTPSGQNGFYSIRAALLLAASDPEGLSVLSLLQHWPTDIHVDIGQVLELVGDVTALLEETQEIMQALPVPSAQAPESIDPGEDWRQPGSFAVRVETLSFSDPRPLWGDANPEAIAPRPLIFDLYRPDPSTANPPFSAPEDQQASLPVVLISNGLGARRDRFEEVANHLASHGFAVVALDHPGSDRQRLQGFYSGLYSEHFAATEYIDRPLDISAILDYLDQQAYGLNLEDVGVLGYSFGGTTAFSLAGATMDRGYLQDRCQSQRAILNISLLYQCRALALPDSWPTLKDDRVQAVYVFVPFGRSLFGSEGLAMVDVPVFWEATNLDLLTPLAIEQWPAFQWLTTPHRYMAIAQGLPHARLTLDAINQLTGQSIQWETLKPITVDYHNMLSLSFFSTHLTPALTTAGAGEGPTFSIERDRIQALMHPDYPLRLIFPTSDEP